MNELITERNLESEGNAVVKNTETEMQESSGFILGCSEERVRKFEY